MQNLILAYLIVNNIVPRVSHKNLVSLVIVPILHCLISHIPLNRTNFLTKHMFATKNASSHASLPYEASLIIILDHFGVDCSHEPSESS